MAIFTTDTFHPVRLRKPFFIRVGPSFLDITMIRKLIRVLCLAIFAVAVVACDDRKEDILEKSENAKTREQLRAVIGDPDDVSKVGPVETWTYQASNGNVTFTFAGKTVMLRTTGGKTN
jgi:hypothetical protein